MSYGFHHARSTEALTWLMAHPLSPAASELTTVLTCRAALLGAHRERCNRATHGADVRAVLFKDRRDFRDFGSVAQGGAVALSHLLAQYPSFQRNGTRFTDVLGLTDLSAYSSAWVDAARDAVLATEQVASSTSWTEHPGTAWTIVADVADAAEALTVMDRHLAQSVGQVLPEWEPALRTPSAELRLVARHIGYVARAGELDPATDAIRRCEPLARPLQLRGVEDLTIGIKVSERLLDRSELSIQELRSFALMHSDLARVCADLVTDPKFAPLRDSFLRRDEQFRRLAGATARVASIGPSSARLLMGQTQEIGRVLLAARGAGAPVSPNVLSRVNLEQPNLGVALATNVGKAVASGRYLVVDDSDIALRWRRAELGESLTLVESVRRTAMLEPASALHAPPDRGLRPATAVGAEQDVQPGPVSADRSRRVMRSSLDLQPYWHRPPMPNRRPSARASM